MTDFWHDKRVMVTGGCGFIGSYVVEELVQAGAKVTAVDNLERGRLDNLAPMRDEVEFIQGDLRDRSFCHQIAPGFDVVMNLVGRAYGMEYSMKHHGEMLYHNTVAQLNMLEAARAHGVSRFLTVSSACVYNDEAPIPTIEANGFAGQPEAVNVGYGWAKRIAELQAIYYHEEFDIDIAIVRPYNPYGDRYIWMGTKSQVIPTLVKRVMDGEDPVVVWGSGQQKRSFLHVRDTARLMMLITERHAVGEPINIGYDGITITEVVETICKVAGKSPEIVYDHSKPEGNPCKCADSSRMLEVTGGYQQQVSLEDGLREMVGWYQRTFEAT